MIEIKLGRKYKSKCNSIVTIELYEKSKDGYDYQGSNGHWYNRKGECFSLVHLMNLSEEVKVTI